MSDYKQELGYDLFSMDLFALAKEEAEKETATESKTVSFFAKPAAFKNYADLKALKAKREKEKIALMKNAPIGTVFFGSSHDQFVGLNDNGEMLVKTKRYIDTGKRDPNTGSPMYEMGISESDTPEVYKKARYDRVDSMEINEERYFFTRDPYNPISLVKECEFKERANGLSEKEVMNLVIYEAFMHEPLRIRINNGERINSSYFMRHSSSNTFRNIGGFYEAYISTNKNYRDDTWDFNVGFLDSKLKVPFDEMDQKYVQYIQTINSKLAQDNATLADLDNGELMGWYKCAGYDVRWNIVTDEWVIIKAYSKKAMFVEREQLEDFEKFEFEYNKFVTTVSPKRTLKQINRTFDKKETFNEKYNQPIELKQFKIPEGASIDLLNRFKDIVSHSRYIVKEDSGKYVELIPVGNGGVVLENLPNVQLPRKEVRYIGMKNEEGHHFGLVAPYAIPADVEPTSLGLKEEAERFADNFSPLELKQGLVLDYVMGNGSFFAAFEEKDYELAEALIAKAGVGGSTATRVLKCWKNTENSKISYHKSGTTSRETILQLTTKQAFEIFFDMYSAVKNTPVEQLTLFELELKYKMDYKISLRTEGIRGHFRLDNEIVHTTKYNLLDLEGTVTKLGLK